MTTNDINLPTWCLLRAERFRDYEQREMAMYPDSDNRDMAIVEWTVRCLANPLTDGSRDALALIAGQHDAELNPTGTAEWLKNRVNELTAELAAKRWSLPEEPTNVTAVRDRSGQLWVCPGRPGNNLWWRDQLGRGIGYEWHQLLKVGPLTAATHEPAEATR